VTNDPATVWTPLTVAQWYSIGERAVEVASATAVWYHPGQPTVPLRWVLIRDPQAKFTTQALPCTDLQATPGQILAWFVQRWQLEVTFEEARRHLGLETQRQWSDPAIARTTPALLGLFSRVALLADQRLSRSPAAIPLPTWSRKDHFTFADALALVRRELWAYHTFRLSTNATDTLKVPRVLIEHLTDTLCYAPELRKSSLEVGEIPSSSRPGQESSALISGTVPGAPAVRYGTRLYTCRPTPHGHSRPHQLPTPSTRCVEPCVHGERLVDGT
jgi:hypothetical protein